MGNNEVVTVVSNTNPFSNVSLSGWRKSDCVRLLIRLLPDAKTNCISAAVLHILVHKFRNHYGIGNRFSIFIYMAHVQYLFFILFLLIIYFFVLS